jgi:hypothetical protein
MLAWNLAEFERTARGIRQLRFLPPPRNQIENG